LNEKTLSLFENENVNALIKTIKLENLSVPKRPALWEKLNCFQLTRPAILDPHAVMTVDEERTDKEAPLEQTLMNICVESEQNMHSWMHAI
jgi:hypothetical protein